MCARRPTARATLGTARQAARHTSTCPPFIDTNIVNTESDLAGRLDGRRHHAADLRAQPHPQGRLRCGGRLGLQPAYAYGKGNYANSIRSSYGIASDGLDYVTKTAGEACCPRRRGPASGSTWSRPTAIRRSSRDRTATRCGNDGVAAGRARVHPGRRRARDPPCTTTARHRSWRSSTPRWGSSPPPPTTQLPPGFSKGREDPRAGRRRVARLHDAVTSIRPPLGGEVGALIRAEPVASR
jgi:hypothetical protein